MESVIIRYQVEYFPPTQFFLSFCRGRCKVVALDGGVRRNSVCATGLKCEGRWQNISEKKNNKIEKISRTRSGSICWMTKKKETWTNRERETSEKFSL